MPITVDRSARQRGRRRAPWVVTLVVLLAGTACVAAAGGPGATFLARSAPAHVRVATWNVGANSIFAATGGPRAAAFPRVLRALDPDVLCLNEIFPPYGPDELARLLDGALPLAGGARWQVFGERDNFVAARHALRDGAHEWHDYGTSRARGHVAVVVEVPAAQRIVRLEVVCAHFQSRPGMANVGARQAQGDRVVALLRARHEAGLRVDGRVVMGDFNAYADDGAPQVAALARGDVVDEERFGPDFPLRLADALPAHNGRGPERWTWRDDAAGYAPGALDRVLYSADALAAERSFVLLTTELTPAELAHAGLEAGDSLRDPGRVDHLPVVVDLRLAPAAGQ